MATVMEAQKFEALVKSTITDPQFPIATVRAIRKIVREELSGRRTETQVEGMDLEKAQALMAKLQEKVAGATKPAAKSSKAA